MKSKTMKNEHVFTDIIKFPLFKGIKIIHLVQQMFQVHFNAKIFLIGQRTAK